MPHVLVWDIETIPDISGFAAANALFDKSAEEVRAPLWATSFRSTSTIRSSASGR